MRADGGKAVSIVPPPSLFPFPHPSVSRHSAQVLSAEHPKTFPACLALQEALRNLGTMAREAKERLLSHKGGQRDARYLFGVVGVMEGLRGRERWVQDWVG